MENKNLQELKEKIKLAEENVIASCNFTEGNLLITG